MTVSLLRIANRGEFQQYAYEKVDFTPNKEILDWVSVVENRLSKFYLQEISFYFTKGCWFGLVLLKYIQENNCFYCHDLVNYIKNQPPESIVKDMLAYVIHDENGDIDTKSLGHIMKSQENLDAYMQEHMYVSEEEKEKILEVYCYPNDTKDRFIRLLERYYEVYKEKMDYFYQKTVVVNEKLKRICEKDPEKFFNEYLQRDYNLLADSPRVLLIACFFIEVGTLISIDEEWQKPAYVIYGCNICERVSRERQQEKRKLFFKILSEEKRIELIKRLAKRPYYIYELGKELNLTSATVSYHVGMLVDIGIVRLEKDGHRFYYELKKDKLKELFDMSYEELIN